MEEDLTQAIEADPGYGEAYIARAAYWLGVNRPEETLEDAQEAESLLPESPYPYLHQAQALLALGEEVEDVLPLIEQAQVLDVTLVEPYLILGQVYMATGETEKALESLEIYQNFASQDSLEYLLVVGQAYYYGGEYEEAVSVLTEALEQDDELLDALIYRGLSRVARTKQPQNVPDVRLDEDYYELFNGSTRSQLSVPMLHKERFLGVISVESPQLGAFSENDQVFVSQLADQAAVAVVNAELFTKATRERDRLDTLLDSVGEAILMIQNNGHVLLTNKLIQDFTGSQLDEIFGVHFTNLPVTVQAILGKHDEDVTPIEDILAGKSASWPINNTYQIVSLSPRRIINREVFPMGEEESRQGIVIVLRDITEEIQIRQERELINETLVHDLRSPTSAVFGALDIIEDILPESEEEDVLNQSVRVAQRGTQRVLRLINTLLDISRLEEGRMELILDKTNLADIVDDLLIEFVSLANQAGIILENRLSDDLPLLWVDVDKLKRVIFNLADNAIKFTPEGGKVTLSASRHGDSKLLFQVHDTGPGISPDYREKIFDRFVQVPGLNGRRRGSGLGLKTK